MSAIYSIRLNENDLGMLLDGLEIRADSWRRTAAYLRNPVFPDGEHFLIEECSKPEEADSIAAHYRSIVETIRHQMKTQL